MLKFKHLTLSFAKHEHQRFLRAFSDAAIADFFFQQQQEQSLSAIHNPTTPQASEPHFPTSLDSKSYISVLLSCTTLSQIKQLHAQAIATGMTQHISLANKFIYTYAQRNAIDDAFACFNTMGERDSMSWSAMVGGFVKVSDYKNCLSIFREAIRQGVRPDHYSLPFALRACRDTMDLEMGRMIHHLVYKTGVHWDCFVLAVLVDMYSKCGVVDDARKVFDKMPKRDLVTYTVMISACAESGNANESLVLFDRMMEDGVVPDKVAIVSTVYACAKLGAMHKAKLVHDYILRKRFSLDVILGTAMIDMYAKCGSVDAAREIFNMMKEKNVVSWSAMIAAYGYHGHGRKALELFPMMIQAGVTPNRITFVSLLYACSHAGLIDEGRRFFCSMWEDYSVKPDVKHYTCMVDLLGRAGRLEEALKLIDGMTIEKDHGLWGALLGACRIHGNIELAEQAAKSLLELQSSNAGHYVLLSNIYAKAGKWEDVAKIRELMTVRKLKKVPGWTWIELDNKIHRFGVGDSNCPQWKEIQEMLQSLSKKLEFVGYVPDTNFVLHDVDEELKSKMLYTHSEKLAIAFGLISSPEGTPIRMTKNLRVCGDCHTFLKLVSTISNREIIVRDANRFHHFKEGGCSCGDYW